MVKLMNRLHKSLLNRGFRSLLDHSRVVSNRKTLEDIRNRRILVVVQRMRSICLSSAFNSWYIESCLINFCDKKCLDRPSFSLEMSSIQRNLYVSTIHIGILRSPKFAYLLTRIDRECRQIFVLFRSDMTKLSS